jgi:hypothetical protein
VAHPHVLLPWSEDAERAGTMVAMTLISLTLLVGLIPPPVS